MIIDIEDDGGGSDLCLFYEEFDIIPTNTIINCCRLAEKTILESLKNEGIVIGYVELLNELMIIMLFQLIIFLSFSVILTR